MPTRACWQALHANYALARSHGIETLPLAGQFNDLPAGSISVEGVYLVGMLLQ